MDLITILWIMFLVGLIFTAIMALFAGFGTEMGGHDFHMGGGHDFGIGHPDLDHTGGFHSSGEIGLSPVSPITIGTFVGCFGAGGIIAYNLTGNLFIVVISALACGLIGAGGLYYVVMKISKVTQGSSEAKVGELIGEIGEVITPVHGESMGEISYVFKGSRYTGPARSVDGKDINKNKPIKIWRVIGGTFYVKEINPEESGFPEEGEDTRPL